MGSERAALATWPLVGRDGEVADLVSAIEAGRSIVVAGTGGVGKSRVLRALADGAEARGWSTRHAIGTSAAQGIALGAVAHLIPSSALDAPRDRVLHAIVSTIEDASSAPGRVLVVVDDGHLLDEGSATLVSHLVRSTSPDLSVAIAVRSGHEMPDALSGLWKDDLVDRVELRPLGEDDLEALLRSGLGGDVDPVTVGMLARWARGNVLFLRELVRDGVERDILRLDHGVWRWHGPPTLGTTLRELINARHGRLDPDHRDALEMVAIGEPLPAAALEKVVEPSVVDDLETDGLIERDEGLGTVRIGHPLHGEALRSAIPTSRADRLRLDLADAIDRTGPLHPSDRLRVAVLLADAGVVTNAEPLVAAARRAWALRDTAMVERLATAALRAGPNPEADYLLAEAVAERGGYEAALAAWLLILERELPDELRVRVAIAASAVLALTLDRGDRARDLLDQTEQVVRSDEDRARLAASRAALFVNTVPVDEIAEDAGTYADPSLPDQARVFAWLASARERLYRGELDSVLDEADLITAVAERAGEEFPMAAMFVGICRFFGLTMSGRLDDAHEFSTRNREASLTDPLPIAPATWSQGLGIVALTRGHLDEAGTHLRAAAALLRDNDIGNLRHVLHELALTCAMAGDGDGAAAAMAEATTANSGLIEPFVEGVRVDAALAASRGDLSSARRLLVEHVEAMEVPSGFYELPALHDLARYGGAEQAVAGLARWAEVFDGVLAAMYLDQAEAMVASDPDALEAVADRFERAGYDLDAAESLMAAAAILRGRTSTHRRATSFERRAATALARCGSTEPVTPLLGGRGPLESLTPREREVAMLAAGGSSDNDIAAHLVLSVRTVHAHLRSVYRKVGVTSRRELRAALRHEADVT